MGHFVLLPFQASEAWDSLNLYYVPHEHTGKERDSVYRQKEKR